jgi:hypothetical protein
MDGDDPCGNDQGLCRNCIDKVRRDLTILPALYEECGDRLMPVQRNWVTEKVTGSRSQAIPFDTVAAEARSEIMETLASWSALVVSERRMVRVPRRTAAALASFLLRHLDWLTKHFAAADFVDEVSKAAHTARSIEAGRPTGFEVGPCVHPGCDSTIHALIREDGSSMTTQVRCTAGHTWQTHEWLLLANQMGPAHSAQQGEEQSCAYRDC